MGRNEKCEQVSVKCWEMLSGCLSVSISSSVLLSPANLTSWPCNVVEQESPNKDLSFHLIRVESHQVVSSAESKNGITSFSLYIDFDKNQAKSHLESCTHYLLRVKGMLVLIKLTLYHKLSQITSYIMHRSHFLSVRSVSAVTLIDFYLN